MDCDVAAAFDHVSHHEIIKTTLAVGVPPVLIAAWIREYRRFSETLVKLDDILTPGFVAQDRCYKVILARLTYLGQLWTHQPRCSVKCAKTKW